MNTYADIEKQIAELQKQAATLRQQERAQIIAEVKAKIKDHGLTAADLGLGTAGKPSATKNTKVIKYRDANGNTWSGGRGRKPQWVLDVLAAGKDISQFAV
jgi:DNA-binding protein H-NS